MSWYCTLNEKLVSRYPIFAHLYKHACEMIIPFLGIHPVTPTNSYFGYLSNFGKGIFDLSSIAFHIAFFLLTTAIAFALGIYVR